MEEQTNFGLMADIARTDKLRAAPVERGPDLCPLHRCMWLRGPMGTGLMFHVWLEGAVSGMLCQCGEVRKG